MSQIVPYLFESKEVRVVLDEKGEPWFVAADVCAALQIGNPSDALNRLDADERGLGSVETPSGAQQMGLVNEPGLYALVLGSRKPEAKRFKRWVTHEVLPAIRKTGRYEAPTMAKALPATYLEALKALVASEEEKERLAAENAAKEAALAAQAPKMAAYARFMDSSGTMNLRDAIKVLGGTQQAYINRLIEDEVLFRTPAGPLRAYAHWADRGYFVHRAGASERTGKAYAQVRVTPAGLNWLSARYPPKSLATQAELL
jgi:prophage antirepressor-like protein